MNSIAALTGLVAVAAAFLMVLCAPIVEPPPVRPIGAFTKIILALQQIGGVYANNIDALFLSTLEDINIYIQQHGGLYGDLDDYLAFENKTDVGYWQTIEDNVNDLAWIFGQQLTQALDDIEREFVLVINQPLVRSWLRQLRQLGRIGHNRALESVRQRHQQDIVLSGQFNQQAVDLIRSLRNGDSQVLQQRYSQYVVSTMGPLSQLKEDLKNDQAQITNDMIQQGLALANNIYQVEIEALKYFVS